MVKRPSPPPTGLEFQGKDRSEQCEFYFRQHWIRLAWPFTKVVLWNILLLSLGYVTFIVAGMEAGPRHITMLLFAAFFVMSHFEFLSRFYRYFLYVIVITDKKVHRMKKTLLIFDDHQSIDLWMLQDILKCQHGVIQNVFGFGSLILEAQETVLRIHFVPWVTNKYKRLMSLREQARQRMNYPPGRLKRLSRSSTSVEEINPFPNVASVL